MAKEFQLEILTPSRALFQADVTEVVFPAHDGEYGVLADHENAIGLIGTGPLKLVKSGDDYWYMLSEGVYEVSEGTVRLLADLGEEAGDIDVEQARVRAEELEKVVGEQSTYDKEYPAHKRDYDRSKARIEVHRRTELVN